MGTPDQCKNVELEKETAMLESELEIGHVEVEAQAVGLNAKGIQVLSSKNRILDGAWPLERTAKDGSFTVLR